MNHYKLYVGPLCIDCHGRDDIEALTDAIRQGYVFDALKDIERVSIRDGRTTGMGWVYLIEVLGQKQIAFMKFVKTMQA